MVINGIAVPYNVWTSRAPAMPTQDRGAKISECIRPGAFAAALRQSDASHYLTVDIHDPHPQVKQLARRADGTLRLFETDEGLAFEATLTTYPVVSQRVLDLIRSGFIRRCCLTMATHPVEGYPPGACVEILQIPSFASLTLTLFRNPRFPGTSVQEGPSLLQPIATTPTGAPGLIYKGSKYAQ